MINDLLITENFFPNPNEERRWALSLDYSLSNFPGRSDNNRSLPIHELDFHKFQFYKNLIYRNFGISNPNFFQTIGCSFQFNVQNDYTEVHYDSDWDVAGVVYLTPDAPKNSGTAFYRPEENGFTKVYETENFYNRAIIYPAALFHEGQNFFGDSVSNSRLNLVFFATVNR